MAKLPVSSGWRGELRFDDFTLDLTVVQSSSNWGFHRGLETILLPWRAIYDINTHVSQCVC